MAKKYNPRELVPRSQLDKELRGIYRKASHIALVVFLMALRDSEKFGELRLNRVYDHAIKFFEEVNEGRVSVEEFEHVLRDEVGVNFVDKL